DHRVEHALACGGIAVPSVGPVPIRSQTVLLAQIGNELFLRQDVPRGIGLLEPLKQPLLLLGSGQCAVRIDALGAAVRRGVATARSRELARLLAAVLATVQHREADQIPEPEPLVQAQGAVARNRSRTQRHVAHRTPGKPPLAAAGTPPEASPRPVT